MFFQVDPIIVRHDNEEPAVFGLFNSVDRADVRMIQSGSRLGFMDETLLLLFIRTYMRREKLECHNTVKLGVLGFVHHTHAALTDLF